MEEFDFMWISNNQNLSYTDSQCNIGSGMMEMLNISTSNVSKFNMSASDEIENTYNNSFTEAIGFDEKFNITKNYEIIFKNDVSVTYYQIKLYDDDFLKDRNKIMARKVKQKKMTITREVAKSTSINGITNKTT